MITGQTTSNTYQGDGSNRVWAILFEFTDSSQIKLRVNGKGITTNYSIDIVDKTVTYPTVESELEPLNSSQEITIYRETPITQDIDFINGGPLNAEMIEDGLDKLTQILQEGTNMNIEGFKIVPEVDENSTNEEVVGAKAIYELINDTQTSTSELKNKTIDADENTIKDLTTSNFKSDVIQTSVRDSETATDTNLVTEKAVRTELDTKQDTLTFDEEPTENSDNPVTSGGVYNALSSLKGPYLFDIKINSEPLAQKGWSCISYPTQNKLVKYDVPTAYEFLKDKLDNADATISPLTTVLNTSLENAFAIIGDMVYFVRESYGIYKASYTDFANTANWIKVCNLISSNGIRGLSWDIEHKLVGYVIDNYPNTPANVGVIVNLETGETVAQFEAQSSPNYSYNTFFFENCFYVSVPNKSSDSCYRYNLSTSTYEKVYDNYNVYGYYADLTNIFAHYNGYYYFNMKAYSETIAVRATDIMDVSTYDQNYLVYTKHLNRISVYKDNKLYGCSSKGNNSSYAIDRYYDLLTDTLVTNINLTPYNNIRQLKKVYFGYIIGTSDTFYFTNNFESYTELYNYGSYSYTRNCDSNGSFVILNISGTVYCSAPNKVLTVYTDTINGIDIKYYKNGDWKICTPTIAVGNDDNLQDVYEYLGYLNYWWIDTTNEQITLQRNSNMWTMMYVGDDYEDDSLPSGQYKAGLKKIVLSEAPTTSTVGSVGDICIDTTNGDVYICTGISSSTYTWSQISIS